MKIITFTFKGFEGMEKNINYVFKTKNPQMPYIQLKKDKQYTLKAYELSYVPIDSIDIISIHDTFGTEEGGSGTITSSNITDASSISKSILTASDADTIRKAIGAGTSDLV